MHENERLKTTQHKMIKAVVKDAYVKERQHLTRTIEKLKVKNLELSHSLTSLTNRTIDAEKEA
jgi:predicted  nucleic acid-binding Zn-ribbon protein